MPNTLVDLLAAMDKDRRGAAEVFTKLPLLMSMPADSPTGGFFTIDFDGVLYTLPSIPKMQADLSAGGLQDLQTKMNSIDSLVISSIQAITMINNKIGQSSSTPNWRTLDFSKDNTDADISQTTYRANVESGSLGFAFDAEQPQQPERRYATDGARIGDFLLPSSTDSIDKRWTALTATGLNVSAYPAFTKTVQQTTSYSWSYYYGYYYWWYGYYNSGSYSQTSTYTIPGTPVTGSMAGQTFKVTESRVLKGFNLNAYIPSANIASAPFLLLVETTAGAPDLSKKIAQGTFRNDAAFNSSATSIDIYVDLNNPVLLDPAKQYAFIVVCPTGGAYMLNYASNPTQDGQVFFTQDGSYWQADLAKDFCYSLRYADFGAGITQSIIELTTVALSGGISSLSLLKIAQENALCNLKFQISFNGMWQDIGVINSMQSLPAQTPVRAIFNGTQKVMPLLDVSNSLIKALRPSTNFIYISKQVTRQQASVPFRVTFNAIGFKSQYHTLSVTIRLEDGTEVAPMYQKSKLSADGNLSDFDLMFKLPVGKSSFAYVIRGTSQTASLVFNILAPTEYRGGM